MFDGSCLVFVEVRYRGPSPRCTAAASVDLRKRGKLVRSAAHFLASRPRFADMCTRFDVVAIDERAGQGQAIEWIRDAFRPGDS